MSHHYHDEDTRIVDQGALSEREKLVKLLEYWIKHNEEHAKTYLQWSKKADTEGSKDVVNLLEEASRITLSINKLFQKALKRL